MATVIGETNTDEDYCYERLWGEWVKAYHYTVGGGRKTHGFRSWKC